jgi:hypothetical protein
MCVTLRTILRQSFKLKEDLNTTEEGTGIFDLKRTQIYTHTSA